MLHYVITLYKTVLVDLEWREIPPLALKKQAAMLWGELQGNHRPGSQRESEHIFPTNIRSWILPPMTWNWKKIPNSRKEYSPANTQTTALWDHDQS